MRTFRLENRWFDGLGDLLDDFNAVGTENGYYLNTPAVFDIETSSFYKGEEKQSCMYAWVFGINGRCIRGRTWGKFYKTLQALSYALDLSEDNKLIVWVHNLAYEWGFMAKYFNWISVFSLDNHQPVKALCDLGIEFRCSYILSGYNLASVGKNLTKYKVQKMVSDLDYDKIRHSKTPLSDKEWGYILNDGLVVMAYIQEEIERMGNIAQLPLTKTGYVRNLCRENTLKGKDRFYYSGLMENLVLTPKTYSLMQDGFAGGFTHANHNYVGKVCKNVSSFDFTSSYPAVLCSEKFPMSEPKEVNINSENDFEKYLNCYCCLFTIHFHNIVSKVSFEHYISISKCSQAEHYILDNGRVVEASDITLTITDVDFNIIRQMYAWEYFDVDDFYVSQRGYLPKDFVLTILTLYKDKTALKNVEGKEVEYQVAKGMLNSLYGMCVTDPCRDIIEYTNEQGWTMQPCNVEEMLKEFNENGNRFIFYEWGIFCTAYARANLFSGILEFRDDYIYADTDSLKVFNVEKHINYINEYNKNITNKIERCLDKLGIDTDMACPCTIDGVAKPLGVWDREPDIAKFITLGAKRYMYEDMTGGMHLTISGVAKKQGLEYLRWKYGTNDNIFKNFNDDLIFPARYGDDGALGCGKMLHTYIEYETEGDVVDYLGNTGHYHELTSVHLEPTSYELSMDFAFLQYLKGIREIKG